MKKKRVVLVTLHYLGSKRKAGFHWLADAYHRAGYEVLFFTTAISWLSYLRRDHRLQYPVRREANRIRPVDDRLGSFVWFTPWHPVNLRCSVLNRLATRAFSRYGECSLGEAAPWIAEAGLVVFESTPGLLLFDQFKRLAPGARFVYRVSDHLPLLKNHPLVLQAERRAVPDFDLISVPSAFILSHFADCPNATLHHHGLRKDLFDTDRPSPYSDRWESNLLFLGNNRFDYDFLRRAARLFPDRAFHVIGPIADLPEGKNIFAYGEIPFEETIPFTQNADVGLQTLAYAPGVESFTDSLKVGQYTYCRLPVIAPEFLRSDRANLFYYQPGDDASIRRAVEEAGRFDRSQAPVESIRSWDELAQTLAGG